MKTKLLFLVATLFLAIAIFSCQKEVESPPIENQKKSDIKPLSGCKSENYDFTVGQNANGTRLRWNIRNNGGFMQTYFPTRITYLNGNWMATYYHAGVNVPIGGQLTVETTYNSPNYNNVFLLRYKLSHNKNSSGCMFLNPPVGTYGFRAYQLPGMWKISGWFQNGESVPIINNRHLVLDCKFQGNTIYEIPIVFTENGTATFHSSNFLVYIDNEFLKVQGTNNYATEFSVRVSDDPI